MHWSLFALAGLALIAAHTLKLPQSGGRFAGIAAFLIGLMVSVAAIKSLAAAGGLGRTTEFDRIVNAAVLEAQQDPAPLIVFTGASYSRNGLDPERLSLALRERGYSYRAVSLSIEAASILERDAHLQQFIKLSGRTPDLVFVEISKEFDHRAAFMFGNSKFNARAIEQFDLKTTAWTALGLSGRACDGLSGCVKDAGFLGVHALLNLLNVGLIGKGEAPAQAGVSLAYDPQTKPRAPSTPADAVTVTPGIAAEGPQWVRSYRAKLQRDLLARGVRGVGYYQPPVLDPDHRAYAEGLCLGELKDSVCLHPNDPALMSRLTGDVWFDPGHLLDDGAAIYTGWLADQLIASGLLETAS